MNSKKSKVRQIVAGAVGVAMAFSFVAGGAIAPASAQTVESLTAQINSLLSTIAALQAQLSSMSGGTTSGGSMSYTFTRNLTVGDTGEDVKNLQKVLNMSADTQIAASGVGSSGNESTYFGSLTRAAVIKFQNKYASEVLTPVGLTSGTGYVGASTRAKLNAMGGTTGGTTGGTVVPPAGSTLAVAAATQPAPQLAPSLAARVPFTRFTLTAGSAAVTVNSVTVERVGPAQDAAFSGIVLVDESGAQVGIAKTLNSNHQATIGEPITIPAGTTRTFTVAGNVGTVGSTYAGEVPAFSVIAINTSVPVVGSLPITGTGQTLNGTLTIGTVSMVETYDPGAQDKPIGTSAYKFVTIKVTASNEDARLYSVRWNQSGSASASDLANVMVEVDGVKYPSVISADGKYYTANFGSGIVVAKGFSKEISVVADVVGGPGRTVAFDIYRNTDLHISGETYKYGITPPTSGSSGTFGSTNPWYDGSVVTVQAGSVTTIGKATEVASQNVAVNVPNQPLGGFVTEFVGEPISVQTLTFTVSTGTVSSVAPLTNVTIVDQNGAVVAGPKDMTTNSTALTFTDTVTFPVGRRVYTIKGTVATTFSDSETITITATPASWSNITGQTTGNSIDFSALASVAMNQMTVKTASLTVTMSTQPVSQNIVAGGQDITFANLQLDASQSGEDIRLSQLPITLSVSGGNAAVTHLTGCQLYDGATALNTGSNVPTSLSATGVHTTFTLDAPLIVSKGTIKTIALKCDVSTAVTGGSFTWSVDASDAITATGITSGSSVAVTETAGNAGSMSVGVGSLAVTVDSSSPSYTIAAGGTSGVTMGVIKFRATNEPISLTKLGLKLTNTASSSATDLISVSIWDGATQVGSLVFTGSGTSATSTLTSPVLLPKDTDKTLTIKANLADIGSGQPGTEGHLVAIDPLNAEGNGQESGTTIQSGATAGVAGVRLFNTFPTLALDTLGSTGLADGRLIRFKVTADSHGPVGLYQFSFKVASTSATVTNVTLYGYTDSAYSSPISGQGASGLIGAQADTIPTNSTFEVAATTNAVQVPAGVTYYFELRASVAGVTTGSSVVTTLEGDTTYPNDVLTNTTTNGFVASTTAIDGSAYDSFIWSPNATTTSGFTANDWTNGYGVVGLPASGLIQTRSN